MEFAFYTESGELHDSQEIISQESVNPATEENYTDEELDGLHVYDMESLLSHKNYFAYMAKDHTELLRVSLEGWRFK